MKLKTFFVFAALSFTTAAAVAADPVPGDYIAEHGWGGMSVKRQTDGSLRFSINSLGANGHSCMVGGAIRHGGVSVDDLEPGSNCTIGFQPGPQGIAVVLGEAGTCREFCGMRASFDGPYLVPAPGCSDKERKATQAKFGRLYHAKDYAGALALLQPELGNCAATLFWLEDAQIRNDVAVTLHHLGRNEECLATLKSVVNGHSTTEDGLRDELPPTDFDNFLPLARAAWFNIQLCSGK